MQEYRDRECQDTVDGVSAFLSACVVLRGKGKTWTLPLLTGSQRDERQMENKMGMSVKVDVALKDVHPSLLQLISNQITVFHRVSSLKNCL